MLHKKENGNGSDKENDKNHYVNCKRNAQDCVNFISERENITAAK